MAPSKRSLNDTFINSRKRKNILSVPLWEHASVSIMGNYEVFGVLTAILSIIGKLSSKL